jgi:multidrug efflux pump
MPLLLATGAGAESRSAIGSVVVYGVGFSCLLTLYIVPTMYMLLARNSRSPEYVSRLLEKLRSARPASPEPAQSPAD